MSATARRVQRIVHPEMTSDGAGVRLRRAIASSTLDYLDPFLLLDHFGSDNPDDYIAGFPIHPHRGMETVTYVLAGEVKHRDSLGHSGTVGTGDVQWMTAGSGIMHEEMPQLRGGHLSGFQLWVNLPAKIKMTQPRYQEIGASRIPEITGKGGSKVKVIAGVFEGTAGPVTGVAADPTYLDISLPAESSFDHAIPRGHTAFGYIFEGAAAFADEAVKAPNLIVLTDGDSLNVRTGKTGARFLLISGKPLGEPVARYGPFVMNTEGEIREALLDLQRGTFVKTEASTR
jgi:redox-sensitive bicupin YhaK (pirin superfamily)